MVMFQNGPDAADVRDCESLHMTNAEVYARSHPTVKVVITFLDNDKRTYGAIRAVEVLSSRMNCGTIKSVVCEDAAFQDTLWRICHKP